MKRSKMILQSTALTMILGLLISTTASAQHVASTSIEEEYDYLTAKWLEASLDLKEYSGLTTFCKDASYKEQTIGLLETLHHYDSLVLDIINDPANIGSISHKEYKKTFKDIEKFETNYGIKEFISLLNESCATRRDLERNKKDLSKESGMYSYDGQLLVLETQLRKFLKHIDKKVVAIDEHLHLIHPDQIKSIKLLARTE